jgi:hypothetical protein
MSSLIPEKAKEELKKNDEELGIFKNLFDQEGRPGDALSTLDSFKDYLRTNGIEEAELSELQGTIESVYEALKLGRLDTKKTHGGERARVDFSQSNFAKSSERMKVLNDIATHNKGAYWAEGWRDQNISMGNAFIFSSNPHPPKNIKYDNERRTYANANRTMEAGLRIDRENGVPKKMPISDGLALGLITPEKAKELQSKTPPLTEFTPLYVIFRPTQSIADGLADARNIGGHLGVPQNVRDADALAQTIIDHLKPGVVPIFTGHSMGGMLAHAVGAKHNCASIGFNPLGLGSDVRKFIDEGKGNGNNCKLANDVAHAECHPSLAMRGDWVSDGSGSLVAKVFVKKPDIGQRYMMEDRSGATGMANRHNAYNDNIENIMNAAMGGTEQGNIPS